MIYLTCFVLLTATCRTGYAQKDTKIIGGEDANITQFPFQLSLNTSKTDCGASIISADWALTAAHCFMVSKVNVTFRAGSTYRNWGGTVHNATAIYVHENFSTDTADYDIAVVKVTPPFPIGSNSVAAVKLASNEPQAKSLGTVSGYGLTSPFGVKESKTLKSTNLKVRNRALCKFAANIFQAKFTNRMICASALFKGSCHGDSGGPFISNTTGEQIGIVSFGLTAICAPGMFDYYTNVANLRDWIKNVTGV